MPELIACPPCGAPLDVKDDRAATIRCRFCGQSIRLSVGATSPAIQATVIRLAPRRAGIGWVLMAAIFVCLMGGGLALAVGAGALPILVRARTIRAEVSPSGGSADAGWGRQMLSFGEEGIGPGLFQDARSIGIDSQGRVYVGEYQGGRIQVFDAEGAFLTQWFVDRDLPLTGMAVSRDGTAYTVQEGEIGLRDGMTGELRRKLTYAEGDYFDDVSLAAGGGLVAAWYANRDDIVVFDALGQPAQPIEMALSGLTGDSELSMRVAIDGLGDIYVLGRFHEVVFRLDPDGRYVSRFGSAGDEPGQFTAPGAIAVDGQGCVYIGDSQGVQVFDATGRYLGVVTVEGFPFGLAFDPQGDRWVAAGTQVFEFDVEES